MNRPLKKPRISATLEEIAAIDVGLEKAYTERTEIRCLIWNYSTLLSPIRRLPAELIEEIFFWCTHGDNNPTMGYFDSPRNLTNVCITWREIALSSKRLWSSIYICVPRYLHPTPDVEPDLYKKKSERVFDKRIKDVKEWLARSDPYPLDIFIFDIASEDYYRNPFFGQLLECILEFRLRWKHVSFVSHPSSFDVLFEEEYTGDQFPLLETIYFEFCSSNRPMSMEWRSCELWNCEKLNKIYLLSTEDDFVDFHIKWDNLTHLTLDGNDVQSSSGPTVTSALSILAKAPALISCVLVLQPIPDGTVPPHPDEFIYLPNLTSLSVHEIYRETSFMSYLKTPVLDTLAYHGIPGFAQSQMTYGLMHFLAKLSAPRLFSLTSDTRSLSGEHLRHLNDSILTDFRKSCESITFLHLEMPSKHRLAEVQSPITSLVDDEFLHFLTPNERGDCNFPNLEEFRCLSNVDFSRNGFTRFVREKQRAGNDNWFKKLKKVTAVFPRDYDAEEDIYNRLSSEISSGLRIDIRAPFKKLN